MLQPGVWGVEKEVRCTLSQGRDKRKHFPPGPMDISAKATIKQKVKRNLNTEDSLLPIDVWPWSRGLNDALLCQRGRLLKLGYPSLLH